MHISPKIPEKPYEAVKTLSYIALAAGVGALVLGIVGAGFLCANRAPFPPCTELTLTALSAGALSVTTAVILKGVHECLSSRKSPSPSSPPSDRDSFYSTPTESDKEVPERTELLMKPLLPPASSSEKVVNDKETPAPTPEALLPPTSSSEKVVNENKSDPNKQDWSWDDNLNPPTAQDPQ